MSKQVEIFWDTEVKPLAVKCCEGIELLNKLEKEENPVEQEKIKEEMKKFNKKDWYAPFYISQMIFYVEHDLADGRSPLFRAIQIRGCLSSEDYYTNVFQNEDCEETRNYKALAKKLDEFMQMSY